LYVLNAGSLAVPTEDIDYNGAGSLMQFGGILVVTGQLLDLRASPRMMNEARNSSTRPNLACFTDSASGAANRTEERQGYGTTFTGISVQ
jgi:hypothetical protein